MNTGADRGSYASSGYLGPFALAPNGKYIAVHTQHREMNIREVASGRQLHTLPFMQSGPEHLPHFSPDGKTLLITPNDVLGSVHCLLWFPSSDTIRFFPSRPASSHSLAVGPDGKLLAVGGSSLFVPERNTPLTLLDAKTGRERSLGLWQAGNVVSAFSPDGKLLAFAGDSSTLIRLWSFEKQTMLYLPRDHTGGVLALAFSPDGKTLATAGKDQTVRLWNVSRGKTTVLLDGLTVNARVLGFGPDGKILVSATPPEYDQAAQKLIPGEVTIWDTASAKMRSRFDLGDKPGCLALSRDGATLALAANGGKITIWDVMAGKERVTLAGPQWIFCMAFSSDGKSLVTSCQNEPPRLWDWATGRERKNHFGSDPAWSRSFRGTSLAFSVDGKTLYMAGQFSIHKYLVYHGVWHYDVVTGKDLGPFGLDRPQTSSPAQDRNTLVASAFSGDGTTLACAWPNLVDIWDLNLTPGSRITGRVRATLRAPLNFVIKHLAFRADGKVVATANLKNLVYLWDTQTGKQLAALKLESEGPIAAVQFSLDGKWLAVAAGKDIRLFDAETGAVKGLFTGHGSAVTSVVFGARSGLLSRGNDGEVKLWDLTTGKGSLTVRGRPALLAIQGLEPDGKTAVTRELKLQGGSATSQVIRRWDLATGREMGQPEVVASNDFFSRDQSTRLTIEFDASIRFLESGHLARALPPATGFQNPGTGVGFQF